MNTEKMNMADNCDATVTRGAGMEEKLNLHGYYDVICIGPDGKEKWRDRAENLVTTVGKNHALDQHLGGSGYSVTGPFMGLISSVSYTSGPAAGDTMSSHGGWTEAGPTNAPNYTGNRNTIAFNAASAGSKAATAAAAVAAACARCARSGAAKSTGW